MYRGKKLRKPARGDWDNREYLEENGRIYDSFSGPVDEEMIREQQEGYYACISHIDHQIGRLLQAMEAYGVLDNTVIVFASDHGEMLSDHCLNRKSVPYQGSIRIPLFIWGPERLCGRSGCVDKRLAELRDIMPTFLGLAGAKMSGLDGLDLLRNEKREYLHGEHYEEAAGRANQFIVTGQDKYIWFPKTGQEQYFRLDTDPQETENAIENPECRERISYLRSLLIKELEGCPEGYSNGRNLHVSQKGSAFLERAD